ncbi:Transcriptional regulatory protein YpdB [Pelotomaculum schinkii]|jgi:two-component system response regulator LytT|uniref:Stage 0 sporulation protein A homolog n=1 Tax=Pelotomaculum schinkii TaxID=78350 RepID=A0A4Y7R8T5_9FIRM|nr:LytTR family DNA-binding domain-containing protein [Pelotomaculum schinkii]TEB05375.1 Transcriptional regulatory protein YpdB [Pelotomaculum schinkii]
MNVVLAEDNPVELNYLKDLLTHEKNINIIGEASNGKEAYKLIKEHNPEVVFLDISMPDITGINLAKNIVDSTIIVFVTAYNEFAIEAFEVGSVDYLLKPFGPERLGLTLERIKKYLPQKSLNTVKKLAINSKGTITHIDISNITYIEKALGVQKTFINTIKNKYVTRKTLNYYESKLADFGFLRVHKSYIININKLEKLMPWGDKSYLAILNGVKDEVLVSRHYAPILKSLVQL